MAPAPMYEHQRIVLEIGRFVGALCERHGRGVLALGINVFNEASTAEDYRIPDYSFVAKGREHILARDGIRGDGSDAVIEVRSPADETYEKFPFFARLGVREVIVVHRDTRNPEVYRLAGSQYLAVAGDEQGWLVSDVLQVRLARTADHLVIEDRGNPPARVEI
jgi:Uma2 family endonuclease